jgi:hypothetical protein
VGTANVSILKIKFRKLIVECPARLLVKGSLSKVSLLFVGVKKCMFYLSTRKIIFSGTKTVIVRRHAL